MFSNESPNEVSILDAVSQPNRRSFFRLIPAACASAVAGRPSRFSVATSFAVGATFLAGGAWIVFAVFGLGFLERFIPSGHTTTFQLVAGALAWTFALTAPPAFGLVGISRLVVAAERARARRPRITPAVRLARAIGDDHIIATNRP